MRAHPGWALPFLAVGLLAQQYAFIPIPNSPGNIERMVEDSHGRLWFATHDDVFCFDGARFFSLRKFGFPPEISYGLAVDSEDAILITTETGIYRFHRGRVERILSGHNMEEIVAVKPDLLLAVERDASPQRGLPDPLPAFGSLYRGRFAGGHWQWELLSNWKSRGSVSRDPAGNILTACPGGWCELPPKLIAEWKPGDAASPILHRIDFPDLQRVVRDHLGCLWFRTAELGAYQCSGGTTPIRLPVAVAGRNVWAAETETADGSMLFASGGSLAMGRNGAFRIVTPEEGLPPVTITSAIRGLDGTVWIGSIEGLYRFPYPFRLEQWRSRHGLVWSFAKANQRVLSGTGAGVAFLNEQRQWTILNGTSSFGSISSIAPDSAGNVYAVVSHQAVILLSRDGRLLAKTPVGQGKGAELVAITRDGSVMVSGLGVRRLKRQGSNLFLDSDSAVEPTSPASIAPDPITGGLWACSPEGLSRSERGAWRAGTIAGKLPGIACLAMVEDASGDLWLGYPGLRMLALAHPVSDMHIMVRHFEPAVSGKPYFLGIDSRGWLWRGAEDGIYIARPDQARAGVWAKLDATDGLGNLNANRHSFFSDVDGSVWWAADIGIFHFFPPADLLNPNDFAPAFLSGFSVEESPATLADGPVSFPHGKKINVHLASLYFKARGALRIRYRCLPEQQDWRNTPSLDIELGTPSWGAHTLEFQSSLTTSPWSSIERRSFTVLRPWWFSWEAFVVLFTTWLAGGAGMLGWYRWRRPTSAGSLPDLAGWRTAALSPELQFLGATLDGRYEIENLVAIGGFGLIFRARDRGCQGRPCAIKMFRSELLDRDWAARRFQQELSALERIHHPSVVSIYSHGVTPENTPYLAMEFIEGVTLRDLLNLGPISAGKSGSILLQASEALGVIHSVGIYHRDVKPENLMLRRDTPPGRELVLIDFSIAMVKEPDKTMHGLSRAAGTVYYMAPEQAIGFAGPASDVYSLAKILLEMLTGERLSTLLPNAAMDLPDRVKELLRSLPVNFCEESIEAIASALQFDPRLRPQDVRSFAQPIGRDLLSMSGSG